MTGGGLYQTVQVLYQCGFSRSGMADEADKLTVRDLQIYILQRMNLIGCGRTVGILYML